MVQTHSLDDVAAQIVLRVQLVRSVAVQDGGKHSRVPVKEILPVLKVPRLVRLQALRQLGQAGSRPSPQGTPHGFEHHPAHVELQATVLELLRYPLGQVHHGDDRPALWGMPPLLAIVVMVVVVVVMVVVVVVVVVREVQKQQK